MPFLTLRSFACSLLIHIIIGGLLLFSFDNTPAPRPMPRPQENMITATAVNSKAVEQELRRLEDIEKQKQQQKLKEQKALERRREDLQQQASEAERQKKQERKRLDEIKKQQAEAAEALKRKQLRLKQEQEAAERKRQQEAEARRAAEEKRRKAQQAEKALKKQLAEERAAEQKHQDQQLLQGIIANINRKVNNNFNKTGLPLGLECILSVQTVPGGEVISVTLKKSSGNAIFDRRAITAVEKSSPLPLPGDAKLFNRLPLRNFTFRFSPD